MQGFRDENLYPIKGAEPRPGPALANGAKDEITLLYPTSPTSIARAQILKYNLEQIGLSVTLKPQPFAVALRTAARAASDFDAFLIAWFADYPDPFDFINVLLDGQNIQAANNSNYSYLSSPKYNKLMSDASKLSGGPLRRVREARRRHDAERRSVGAALERQRARVHLLARHELPVPPGLTAARS
jgi:ABC-type transport system substrate-binding protein